MFRPSVVINDKVHKKTGAESGYSIAGGIFDVLAGVILLLIPYVQKYFKSPSALLTRDIFILSAGWLLLFCMIFALFRTLLFNRGFPDFVMGLFTGALYAVIGWGANSTNLENMENIRLVLCLMLLCTGLSRILVFASLLEKAAFPVLFLYGAVEILFAILLMTGTPSYDVVNIYLFSGILLIFGGVDYFNFAFRVKHFK